MKMSFKCSSNKRKMVDNWHQKCVALVSGVVVNETLGR